MPAAIFEPLLVASALYEPMRLALYRLGSAVGGVGGVGGLTNQWPCDDDGAFGRGVCFRQGLVAGLTPFALVILLAWTLPFGFVALTGNWPRIASRRALGVHGDHDCRDDGGAALLQAWTALQLLWFGVPAAAYLSDPFYKTDAAHVVLGIALSAAFPLSWHLAVVAIPAPRFVASLTGSSRETLLAVHKSVARSAVRWAVVHAVGEIAYVAAKDRRAFGLGPYRFLYWAGAATFATLVVHAAVAGFRHTLFSPPSKPQRFASVHAALAAVVLALATCHWWPFAIFLCPAVAVAAAALALDRGRVDATDAGGLALAVAVLATLQRRPQSSSRRRFTI